MRGYRERGAVVARGGSQVTGCTGISPPVPCARVGRAALTPVFTRLPRNDFHTCYFPRSSLAYANIPLRAPV